MGIKIVKEGAGKNSYALYDEQEYATMKDPEPIMSGLTYGQAEQETLRRNKDQKTTGNSVLQPQ